MATGRIGTNTVLTTRWSKAPAGGTTSLSGLDDNSVSLVYSVGYEQVYRNGVLLSRGNDYTATNGTTITLIDATITGDIIEVFANATIPLTDTYSQTVANGKFINNTLTTTTGDIIYASAANTPARLGIGSTDQVLKVTGGVPAWGAPAGSMTLLHTLTLNATSTTQSTISQDYKILYIVGRNIGTTSSGDALRIRFAGRTGNYQGTRIEQANITALSASGVDSVANDISNTGGSAFWFQCYDYADTTSEKLIIGQTVGNNTGATCFFNVSPFNLQSNIASVTITTVGGTLTMSGTVEIYGVK